MLLVPRQLARVGMTGNVPYYGGRLTPAHVNAISQTARRPSAPPKPPARRPQDSLAALDQLLADGVVTRQEYDDLRARVTR